jgi:hypothetical protein
MAEEERCFRYTILTKQPATAENLSLPEQLRTEVSTAVRAAACQQHFLRPGTTSGGSIGDAVRQTVGAAFNLDVEAIPKPVVTKLQTTVHNILATPNKSSFTIPVSDALNYAGVTKLSDDLWMEVIFMPTGQKAASAGWKKSF